MKRVQSLFRVILTVIFAVTFVVSGYFLADYLIHSQQSAGEYDDLASLRNELLASVSSSSSASSSQSSSSSLSSSQSSSSSSSESSGDPEEQVILPELLPFYETNSDTVGWLIIPGTRINYPVMQTPGDPDYYLKHNFNKDWSDWGAIYARETCDVFAPSDCVTLFGHHMADGSMFTGLDAFKNEAFGREHQTLTFDTLYEHHTYQIWAVFKISANHTDGSFPYHRFTNAETAEEFDEFVQTVKGMQFYETGITPAFGDKLLTLSTCEYTLNNGRFVVCAVRIS